MPYLDTVTSIALFGVAYAMVLYLISVGLSITMGLLGIANLAHGAFAMLGGYTMVLLAQRIGLPFWAALIGAFVLVAALGALLERTLFSRLRAADELEETLLSIGLIFMAMAAAHYVFGPAAIRVDVPAGLRSQIRIPGASVELPAYRALLVAIGVAVFAGLVLLFRGTGMGARIRATVDNAAMAQSIGIDTNRLFTLVFAFGTGLAAVGGALGAEILPLAPAYPAEYLTLFLMVVAVGGVGSLVGPFVAALILGISDTACKVLAPDFAAFFVYLLMFTLLLLRPSGILVKDVP